MKMESHLQQSEIRQLLQPILWDYNIDPYDFYEVALGRKERVGSFTKDRALIRLLERLGWYDLVRLFGMNTLAEILTTDRIARIRIKARQERYEFARKLLHGEPIPLSGWDPEYREKIKHTLLSHRWYRTQPRVFPA
jgi:hypothetical protein